MKKLLLKVINLFPPGLIKVIKKLPLINDGSYYYFKLKNRVPMPKSAIIDVMNICNLNCPICPTGTNTLKQKQKPMSLKDFKNILDQIPTLQQVSLYNWGEPFLNPEIFKIIKYAKSRGIFTIIHSNLSLEKNDEFFEKLIDSGIDRLSVSLDGVSRESYSKYRKNGNFDLVLNNLKKLARLKTEKGAKNPNLVWQLVVNKYNEGELKEAKKIAKKIKVQLNFTEFGAGDSVPDLKFKGSLKERMQKWLPKNNDYKYNHYQGKYSFPLYNTHCWMLFNQPTITPDAKVYPCCFLTNQKNAFGDLKKQEFKTIWNNQKYTSARQLFIKSKPKTKQVPTICQKCNNYKKYR
ncbi:MAG: radical SAM protein [Candidatus Moranbacteria bacterium]|nr:radical SAM protein [Candidatus Moranbacteria bacterium]